MRTLHNKRSPVIYVGLGLVIQVFQTIDDKTRHAVRRWALLTALFNPVRALRPGARMHECPPTL